MQQTAEPVTRSERASAPSAALRPGLVLTGIAMVLMAGILAWLATRWGDHPASPQGRWVLTIWGISAGLVNFVGLWPLRHIGATSLRQVAWIVSIGLVMRAIILPTPPFLEDDYYRYLWDGGIAFHGHNPYAHPPEHFASADDPRDRLPPAMLSDEAREVREQINHPHLTTVYGPVAQAAFAMAHAIAPWSIDAWRGVLLVFDGLTLAALFALLRVLRRPAAWAAWYWWNPILLREIVSSGHMDVVALPLALAALLLAARRAAVPAGIVLALAAGAKIWPVVLLPLVLRMTALPRRTLLVAAAGFVITSAVLWTPAIVGANVESNGFLAYAGRWYNNDAVHRAMAAALAQALPMMNVDPAHARWTARLIAASALLLWIGRQTLRPIGDAADLIRRSLLVLAAMFILSPAQFPWYYLWMLPLLAAAPRPSLLAYTVTLPMYYAHYDRPWLVWIEHAPILAWFAWELLRPGPRAGGAKTRAES